MAVKNLSCGNATFKGFCKLMLKDDDIVLTSKFHKKVQNLYYRDDRTSRFPECKMHLILVKIQHCELHSLKRLQEGHQAQARVETEGRAGSSQVLITNIFTKSVQLWRMHIYELEIIAVLGRCWVSYGALIFPSPWKRQHSNYSVKVNRPQVWLLNLSGYLFSNHQ